jgi:MoaA/NifB/PqqE/SkfB family radical SAM enzyme
MSTIIETAQQLLTAEEQAKRNGLMARKPYVAQKLARISEMEARGEISPIIRLEKSYLCNFQCTHCSAEYYMDRHYKNVLKIVDTRSKMDLDDVRRISREADELGLARFVITGGEPLVMKDFDDVVAALDPEKHYIITDTNGWFLDKKKAHHLKSIGVEKVQLSLDSFIEAEHDQFRNKPGSYKRVMRAIDACLDAELNLILSTVLIKGRAKTEEFRQMCQFCTDKGIGLYVSYAKPTGSCTNHPEFVIEKEDADILRQMEREYKVFTHMTPSYGSHKGCITVKGIITVTSSMEVTPCPYIDFSIGNLREMPLKKILERGMSNPWLGPYRPDCIIGEDPKFIKIHTEKTHGVANLPLPWGKGFTDHDQLADTDTTAQSSLTENETLKESLFDAAGRCLPGQHIGPVHHSRRHYFKFNAPNLDLAAIHGRAASIFGDHSLPSLSQFSERLANCQQMLANDPKTKGLFNGIAIPFVLPQARISDMGAALDETYLPAVGQALKQVSPDSHFSLSWKFPLAGKLNVAPNSRHQALLDALALGPVVGYFFPEAFSEYAIPAARMQIAQLPASLLLAGGIDTCAALIAAPDLLINPSAYPPLLWFAEVADDTPTAGYHIEAYGHDITFNRRHHFGQAAEYWASGITVPA